MKRERLVLKGLVEGWITNQEKEDYQVDLGCKIAAFKRKFLMQNDEIDLFHLFDTGEVALRDHGTIIVCILWVSCLPMPSTASNLI